MVFPVDEKYIEKAESEPGARFPDLFRGKMMQLNGVGVEVGADCFSLHPFYDTSDKKTNKKEHAITLSMRQRWQGFIIGYQIT
jgi:hypothetical protein